jgi:SAM-dependent methyltransferase
VLNIISSVGDRLRSYQSAEISKEIGPHDGMFVPGVPGSDVHYFSVGRSAIEVIAQVMVATRKTRFGKVLDLPCGGGRVTRHLVKFFPDSEIFISELDHRNESFTAATFGAKPIVASPDFTDKPSQTFDLIFVGSLVTHLDEVKFRTALRWFTSALAPDGILVLTTSGRRADYCERYQNRCIDPGLWEGVSKDFLTRGFGYVETERNSAGSYGFTLAAASWVSRLVEDDPTIRLASVQESAWDNHQDIFGIQKRAIG